MWVSGIELTWTDLCIKLLDPLSHLASYPLGILSLSLQPTLTAYQTLGSTYQSPVCCQFISALELGTICTATYKGLRLYIKPILLGKSRLNPSRSNDVNAYSLFPSITSLLSGTSLYQTMDYIDI